MDQKKFSGIISGLIVVPAVGSGASAQHANAAFPDAARITTLPSMHAALSNALSLVETNKIACDIAAECEV